MSRGPGRIERVIERAIADDHAPDQWTGKPGPVLVSSWSLVFDAYQPRVDGRWITDLGWLPTRAQRQAVTRAMRSFVRKHQRYALAGGNGRMVLYLYEPDDPLSAMWTKMTVATGSRKFVTRTEAQAALAAEV